MHVEKDGKNRIRDNSSRLKQLKVITDTDISVLINDDDTCPTLYILVDSRQAICFCFIGVLRRFQHDFSYITETVHLFMIPG